MLIEILATLFSLILIGDQSPATNASGGTISVNFPALDEAK